MKKFFAFLNGMREFRLSMTTAYRAADLAVAYDIGREWAHKLTLRRWDD